MTLYAGMVVSRRKHDTPEHRHGNAVPSGFAGSATAPGYHHGALGRDYCVIQNPHKVSGFEAPRDKVSRTQVVSKPRVGLRRGTSVCCSLFVARCKNVLYCQLSTDLCSAATAAAAYPLNLGNCAETWDQYDGSHVARERGHYILALDERAGM